MEEIKTFDVPVISMTTGDNCTIKAVTFADHLARVQELERELAAVKLQRNVLDERVQGLEREVERLKLPYAGYSFADLGEAEETIAQLEAERDGLKNRLNSACTKDGEIINLLSDEMDSLKAQLAALIKEPTWKEMETLNKRRSELNEDLSFVKAQKAAIREMLETRAPLNAPKGQGQ